MRIFISGGCKNGKSYYAQRLAKAQAPGTLYYLATMRPADDEDRERIQRHRDEREGWGFVTIERPCDIAGVRQICQGSSVLLDSVTALLANEMFRTDGSIDMNAHKKVSAELAELAGCTDNIVIVSDYIYSDAFLYDELTEKYRERLAYVDRTLALECDAVIEIVYGNIVVHKGNIDLLMGEVEEI